MVQMNELMCKIWQIIKYNIWHLTISVWSPWHNLDMIAKYIEDWFMQSFQFENNYFSLNFLLLQFSYVCLIAFISLSFFANFLSLQNIHEIFLFLARSWNYNNLEHRSSFDAIIDYSLCNWLRNKHLYENKPTIRNTPNLFRTIFKTNTIIVCIQMWR